MNGSSNMGKAALMNDTVMNNILMTILTRCSSSVLAVWPVGYKLQLQACCLTDPALLTTQMVPNANG
jgi:hypothetical protein